MGLGLLKSGGKVHGKGGPTGQDLDGQGHSSTIAEADCFHKNKHQTRHHAVHNMKAALPPTVGLLIVKWSICISLINVFVCMSLLPFSTNG